VVYVDMTSSLEKNQKNSAYVWSDDGTWQSIRLYTKQYQIYSSLILSVRDCKSDKFDSLVYKLFNSKPV
jgi:hypothetical protein